MRFPSTAWDVLIEEIDWPSHVLSNLFSTFCDPGTGDIILPTWATMLFPLTRSGDSSEYS